MNFRELYGAYIGREGSSSLLKWLESTDFFEAPASTKYHECYPGGLADHSVKVFYELLRLLKAYPELKVPAETVAIISLLHDVCKANCYEVEFRNRKNEHGQWERYPCYKFNESFCYGGHGSKSVYLIQRHIKLTETEAVAIHCHMGVENGNWAVADAFRAYPLAFLLHTADMASTIDF